MPIKRFVVFGRPDDPDPNGSYDDSDTTGDDEEATCPEDFDS